MRFLYKGSDVPYHMFILNNFQKHFWSLVQLKQKELPADYNKKIWLKGMEYIDVKNKTHSRLSDY